MLDVPRALAATNKSARKLGAEVLAAWKRLDTERDEFPQPEAIGVKLGLLRKGDTKWWTNQPRALDALAQILGSKPTEIVAPDGSVPGAVQITAFGELAPIFRDRMRVSSGTTVPGLGPGPTRSSIKSPSMDRRARRVRQVARTPGAAPAATHPRADAPVPPAHRTRVTEQAAAPDGCRSFRN